MMNTELLNNTVRHLAANGVKVEDTKEFKDAVVGLCVTTIVGLGVMDVKEALDFVAGEGTFLMVSDMCWETINA